jgi:predicted transposase/invertase (TIGR01784 family)
VLPDEAAAAVNEFLEEGDDNMFRSIAQTLEEKGEARGEDNGVEKGIRLTARNMWVPGIDINIISECTNLSVQEIKTICADIKDFRLISNNV